MQNSKVNESYASRVMFDQSAPMQQSKKTIDYFFIYGLILYLST